MDVDTVVSLVEPSITTPPPRSTPLPPANISPGSFEIPDLPMADFEMDDVEETLDEVSTFTPVPIIDTPLTLNNLESDTAPPRVDTIGSASGPISPSAEGTGTIVSVLPTGLAEATDSMLNLDSIVSSLREKDVANKNESILPSTQTSPLSSTTSIVKLPTDLTMSPTKPTTPSRLYSTRATKAAESSAQAAARAQKAADAKAAKLAKARVTQPRAAKSAIPAASVKGKEVTTPKETSGRANSKKNKEVAGDDSEVERPRSRKRPSVKYTENDEDDYEAEDDLRILGEAEIDEKPTGKSSKKRKLVEKPVRIRYRAERQAKAKQLSDIQIRDSLIGQSVELQMGACQRARYLKWGRCVACSTKAGGDYCRFRGLRSFPLDIVTGEITGSGYFEDTTMEEKQTALPFEFSVPLTEYHLNRIEKTAAPILLPLITSELRHIVKNKAIKRMVDPAKDRSYCDFCSCTIFAGYFFCKTCGRDYCLTCERYFSDNAETMNKSPWHVLDAARPRLLKCQARSEIVAGGDGKSTQWHFRPDLIPVSSLSQEELKDHWLALAEVGVKGNLDKSEWAGLFGYKEEDGMRFVEDIEKVRSRQITAIDKDGQGEKGIVETIDVESYYTKLTHPSIPLPADPAGLRKESLPFIKIGTEALTNPIFDVLWGKGEPMVVDGIAKKFQKLWTPNQMVANFGNENCRIMDCELETSWSSTLEEFFDAFKERKNRSSEDIWKLGDFPTQEKFQVKHPGLYEDFCKALPAQDYTLQNGAMNMYSHFPPGPTRPDIGPKMYNAFRAKEVKGGHGSTRLHMDVGDALNIMLYAGNPSESAMNGAEDDEPEVDSSTTAPQPSEVSETNHTETTPSIASPPPETLNSIIAKSTRSASQSSSTRPITRPKPPPPPPPPSKPKSTKVPASQTGCAVWDLFRAEDADKLRQFLSKKFKDAKPSFTDPIHSQMFYLDSELRKELWDTMGVASFRIYQYPGQAVFIPAGCAHQVCNLADCIKIAMDFVSPHNVARCQQLTQDFRKENFVKVWKDDVLQLYNILWFAWVSARETRARREKEEAITTRKPITRLADLDGSHDDLTTTSIGRSMTSSVRDDPHQIDPTLFPPESTIPSVSLPTNTLSKSDTDIKDLVSRLLESALSAPDPEPPEDARPPAGLSGSRWGRAPPPPPPKPKLPKPMINGGGRATRSREAQKEEEDGEEEDEPRPPPMTVAAVKALHTYSRRGKKASEQFGNEVGKIPLIYAMDILKAEMGSGLGDGADDGMDLSD